jgi:hypothetical protein
MKALRYSRRRTDLIAHGERALSIVSTTMENLGVPAGKTVCSCLLKVIEVIKVILTSSNQEACSRTLGQEVNENETKISEIFDQVVGIIQLLEDELMDDEPHGVFSRSFSRLCEDFAE